MHPPRSTFCVADIFLYISECLVFLLILSPNVALLHLHADPMWDVWFLVNTLFSGSWGCANRQACKSHKTSAEHHTFGFLSGPRYWEFLMFLILRKLGRTWNRKFRLKMIWRQVAKIQCPLQHQDARNWSLSLRISWVLLLCGSVWYQAACSGDCLALPAGLVFALLFVRSRDGPVSPGWAALQRKLKLFVRFEFFEVYRSSDSVQIVKRSRKFENSVNSFTDVKLRKLTTFPLMATWSSFANSCGSTAHRGATGLPEGSEPQVLRRSNRHLNERLLGAMRWIIHGWWLNHPWLNISGI